MALIDEPSGNRNTRPRQAAVFGPLTRRIDRKPPPGAEATAAIVSSRSKDIEDFDSQ